MRNTKGIHMDLIEIEKLTQTAFEKRRVKEQKSKQLSELKAKFEDASKEAERLRRLAQVTGKSYEAPAIELQKQLNDLETEISNIDSQLSTIEQQIANGLEDLTVDVNLAPEITPEKAIFKYTEGSCENAINYLMQKLSFTEQLDVDGVVFRPSCVEILRATNALDATEQFVKAVNTLRVFGGLMSGKEPEAVQLCREFLHKSKYRHVWELLATAGRVTLKEIFDRFNIGDSEEKKCIRAFLSDLQKRELSPIASDGRGTFWLTTFGKQVKIRYEATYNLTITRKEVIEPQEATEETRTETGLNKWLDIAYGEKNEEK